MMWTCLLEVLLVVGCSWGVGLVGAGEIAEDEEVLLKDLR